MEQNISDLLKDAFSDFDIDVDLKLDVETDTPQTQLGGRWTKSEHGSGEPFTNVHEPEKSNASSDCSDNESNENNSFAIDPESATFSLSHQTDNDQVINTMMTGAQLLNCTAGDRTAEEGNVHSDLAAGVSTCELVTGFTVMEDEQELTEEEHGDTFNECLPQASPPMSNESQPPGETSSDEASSQCDSSGNEDESFPAMSPDYADKEDMKEFTEDDQEQIEESLADYPSDLSHSETEEPSENSQAQTFIILGVSSGHDYPTRRMEDLSHVENIILQNEDSPTLDHNFETKGLEVNMSSADLDLSHQIGILDGENAQKSLTNDRNIEEDTVNGEDSGDLDDGNDQADDISDSSGEAHSTSQEEETNFLSSVKKEEEKNHVSQHNYSVEDMTGMDDDIDYICVDTGDEDAYSPEKRDAGHLLFSDVVERGVTNTTWRSCYEEPNTEVSSESSNNVEDTKNVITEVLWSSTLMMDEDNLCLDEYDWDLSGDSFKISSGEGEIRDDTDFGDNNGNNNRDWEMEKPRIEAFYRFYGDQAEAEDDMGRNHRVTFCLDRESSEYDEDSDSTEEEMDPEINTTDVNTLKPEYHSESDDPLEMPYYPERFRMQPKEQQCVSVAVKQYPQRNKCLSVLKSTIAFGLLTAMGVVSYWWATENMHWMN